MEDPTVNVLLATFAGLGLPRTLSLQLQSSQPISHAYSTVFARLPHEAEGLVLTTVSNKQLLSDDNTPISSLLSSPDDRIISLRLSRRLCGGKGGFGSQLRAAGGRMSGKKNRQQQEAITGLARNLDGRRLRTIDEAKRLADYLAIKPEMEEREKETRRKRWQEIVDAAEKREEDIRSGRAGANQGRLDSEYVESKEAAEEKTREAVLRAMREEMLGVEMERTGSESSRDAVDDESDDAGTGSSGSAESEAAGAAGVSLFGWDEEYDDDSEEDEDEEDAVPSVIEPPAYEGKGKAKAV